MGSIGITATRHGLTEPQRAMLVRILVDYTAPLRGFDTFRHGDCIGGDAEGAEQARIVGYRIVGHPPSNPSRRAYFKSDETLPELDYHARNRAIVDASAVVLACPDGPERERSGTWSTVRYARRTGARVIMILPDGTTDPTY